MTNTARPWDEPDDQPSRLDLDRRSAYLRRFVPAITVYAALVASQSAWVDSDDSSRWAWSLVPVIPLLWIVSALVRDAIAADEYQRTLITRAMSVGFGAAMVAALVVGMLGAGGVSGPWGGWVVFTAGMLGWSISGAVFEHGSGLRRRGRSA